eukprot:scaffold79348_cov45-Phaeocystis_antarctica.AAC.2
MVPGTSSGPRRAGTARWPALAAAPAPSLRCRCPASPQPASAAARRRCSQSAHRDGKQLAHRRGAAPGASRWRPGEATTAVLADGEARPALPATQSTACPCPREPKTLAGRELAGRGSGSGSRCHWIRPAAQRTRCAPWAQALAAVAHLGAASVSRTRQAAAEHPRSSSHRAIGGTVAGTSGGPNSS